MEIQTMYIKKLSIYLLGIVLLANGVSAVGEDGIALSVTLFIMISALGFFSLPFIVKSFANNELLDMILRYCFHILGLFMMFMNSGIMLELINGSGFAVSNNLILYMRIYGYCANFLILFTIFKLFKDVITLRQAKKRKKRMGDDD